MSDPTDPLDTTIVLASGPVIVHTPEAQLSGNATVTMELLPAPRLVISGVVDGSFGAVMGTMFDRKPLKVELPEFGVTTEMHLFTVGLDRQSKFGGILLCEPIVIGPTADPQFVEFQLLNFPAFFTQIQEGDACIAYQNVQLSDGNLRADLRAFDTTERRVRSARETSGFSVTHQGEITSHDNTPLSVASAEEFIETLSYFLSFARGLWSGPVLPVGKNQNGEQVWAVWGGRTPGRWQPVGSWFDHHNAQILSDAFERFCTLWRKAAWQETVKQTVYWYLASNTGNSGIEASVVLAQAALERLAWTYLVEDRKVLSRHGFKRIPAADQLRLLLSGLGIPLEVPSDLASLQRLASSRNWSDGPDAFVGLRNAFVHPGEDARLAAADSRVKYQAWALGQWYIELSLLSLSGYNGAYANRLIRGRWIGQIEPVPWASLATTRGAHGPAA